MLCPSGLEFLTVAGILDVVWKGEDCFIHKYSYCIIFFLILHDISPFSGATEEVLQKSKTGGITSSTTK